MEYIYAAMLLHKAGHKITDASVHKVLEAAGIAPDAGRIKALCAALDGVNIDEAIKSAAIATAAPAAAPAHAEHKEAKHEHKEEKKDEEAAAGLGALFG